MVKRELIQRLFFSLILLLQAANAFGATITAEVSRNPVSIDETFELIFEADGAVDDEPDFSPLEHDLEILSRSQSQSIRMINGDYSRTTRWALSVMAKRAGQLTLPAISFGSDRSQPLSILVREAAQPDPASSGEDMFMEVSVEPETAYVQQQLIFHLRIYRAVNIVDASLSAPQFNDPDIIVEQLGEEQNFETQRNGRRYLVSQIDYLAFPQASGTLTLEPITFQTRVMQQSRHRFDMFGQAGAIKRIRSKALSIEIKPIPKNATGPWLPLTNLQLSASWPKANPEFRVGEPVTRTLAIVADGVTAVQLPEIHTEIPPGFKQYPDQPMLQDHKDENGVTAIRQEKIALVPTRPGAHVLPAITVRWWNVQTNRQEVARIAEERIQVLPAVGASAPAEPPPSVANSPATQDAKASPELPPPAAPNSGIYPWLALFFALGWLATAAAWWWFGYYRQPKKAAPEERGGSPKAKRRNKILAELREAGQAGDASAVSRALLAWGKTVWPEAPPKGLVELAAHFDAATAANMLALNQSLYGKKRGNWDGDALWRAVKNYRTDRSMQKPRTEKLEPLYLQAGR